MQIAAWLLAAALPFAAGAAEIPPNSGQSGIFYHVFMGELALQRGQHGVAVQEYAQAATQSSDPTLAQQAVTLAYQAGNNRLALELDHHWLALAPRDLNARHFEALLNTRLGNVDAAVQEFSRLIHTPGGDSYALVGELLAREADVRQGLPVMQRLIASAPDSPDAHLALARLALHDHQVPLAQQEAEHALALKPGWHPALIVQSRALLAQGKADAAIAVLAAQVKAEPGDTALRLDYAAVLAQAQHDAAARTQLMAVLVKEPRNAAALYTLGLLELQNQQLPQAQDAFTRLLKTGQQSEDAWYFLGNIAELQKNYPLALQDYEQVDGGRQWFAAQIGAARVLALQGKNSEARTYLDQIAAADPDDAAQLRLAESQMFENLNDHASALAVLDGALSDHPGDGDLLYARALLEESLNQVTPAENDLRAILKRTPENAAALNALGYTLTVHSTRYQEALGYIEKALKLSPDDPAIIDSMGWVEYRLGNYPAALGYLRRAYAQFADPQVAAHLAEVLWVAGDRNEARSVWSGALKQHPGDPDLLRVGQRFSP